MRLTLRGLQADSPAATSILAITRCQKLEDTEVITIPAEKVITAPPSSLSRSQRSAARPNRTPDTEKTPMKAGPANTCHQ